MEYYSAITKNEIISFAVPWMDLEIIMGFQGGASGEERTCQRRRYKRHKSHPWVRKIPLEKETATQSSILAWRIPWTEEPGELQSIGSHRVGHD